MSSFYFYLNIFIKSLFSGGCVTGWVIGTVGGVVIGSVTGSVWGVIFWYCSLIKSCCVFPPVTNLFIINTNINNPNAPATI